MTGIHYFLRGGAEADVSDFKCAFLSIQVPTGIFIVS